MNTCSTDHFVIYNSSVISMADNITNITILMAPEVTSPKPHTINMFSTLVYSLYVNELKVKTEI